MKTKPILLQLLALSALLLPAPPQLFAETNGVQPRLKAVRQGDNVALEWVGGPGIRLQQSGCLCAPTPTWLDVPGSDTNCSLLLPPAEEAEFFRLVDANADTDADLLTRGEEEDGWTIAVDYFGFGESLIETLDVTSDPEIADTDGDGLTDFGEWICGTDPRSTDTDHDGLSDYNEVFRWHTSPTSVDTDGDARGPNHNLPPKMQLFDGKELSLLHTSPTLEDTDGDGRTDYEEYDQLGRSPLIAEVPSLGVELVDAVDIRLDVEYAEEAGTSREYGGELAISDSTGKSYSTSSSMEWSVSVGVSTTLGFCKADTEISVEASVGGSKSVTFETETTKTVERSQSEYTTDSRTRTESYASGSMSGGIRLVNTGPITYTITDLGMTVRYIEPGAKPSFQTLATLVPKLGAGGIALAPGDSTPVLQVEASGLNASRVKQFMARPNSVYLEPAFYELQNAQGLNFDFLEEVTRWRTACIQIDYGDGRSEMYRVATNVERNEDGSYAGVTLGNVLNNILHIPFQTMPRQAVQPVSPSNERVLTSLNNLNMATPTSNFWALAWSGEGTVQTNVDFENIALHAGDQLLLVFVRDNDGDGLFGAEEQHYGSDDLSTGGQSRDSDGDGLDDVFEARTGWSVNLPGRSYHVSSDPAQADQDGDLLMDAQEFALGTDPTKADTDDDGIPDNLDPHPIYPARVLLVKADATGLNDGGSWANALTNLQTALSLARAGLASTTNSVDDVAEIWVAAGVYKPTTTTSRTTRFELVNNTCICGGFSGYETKLSQRDPDPLFNGTVLSGDLNNNDASTYAENPGSFGDNSYNVCYAALNVGPGTIVDGFTITGGCANLISSWADGAGMYCDGNPQLKNLLFRANHAGGIVAGGSGGALFVNLRVQGAEMRVSDCLFLQNDAVNGGGIFCSGGTALFLTNCQFYGNASDSGGGLAAGPDGVRTPRISIEGCTFRLNTATNSGGGITMLNSSALRVSRTQFEENTARQGGAIGTGYANTNINMEVVQSVFYKNRANDYGGAIRIDSPSATISLYVLNSTFCTNFVAGSASNDGSAIDGNFNGNAALVIENSIIWGNLRLGTLGRSRVRTSCLWEANYYPGAGSFNADPKFEDSANGNLRLTSGSPCVDRGNNYADYYPRTPGYQLLPDTDLDGNWRIVDGNADGTRTVDMGAYELQGP